MGVVMRLYLFPGVRKAQEPMDVQTFNPKPAVESLETLFRKRQTPIRQAPKVNRGNNLGH